MLLDLPQDPDLLEQRIGRLDRIGQSEEIRIHVPYFENRGQEVLFHWYRKGMNALEQTNPAGHEIRLRADTLGRRWPCPATPTPGSV